MAIPANPLDKYATYTYHFELHIGTSWDELKKIDGVNTSIATSRFEPKGSLLINTRTDAHQIIDDVQFGMIGQSASRTEMLISAGKLTMKIREPGGFSFIEKLDKARIGLKVNSIANSGVIFALKIILVGRTPDNKIETLQAKLLSMVYADMTGVFTEKGGEYTMDFIITEQAAYSGDRPTAAEDLAFVKDAISIKTSTVRDGFKKLEAALNTNYDAIFKNDAIAKGKKIRYQITADPDIDGKLTGLNADTLVEGPKYFSFKPEKAIVTYVNDIMMASPDITKLIADSRDKINVGFSEGIFIPIITPKVYHRDDELVIHIHASVNRGGAQATYIFDYFFADAGKNVDVMSYEVKYNVVGTWVPTSRNTGFDKATNQSGRMQTEARTDYTQNVQHPDVTKSTNHVDVMKCDKDWEPNDVMTQPAVTTQDRAGYNRLPFDATATIRLASDTIYDFQSCVKPMQTLEIRGHFDILNACVTYPDSTQPNDIFGQPNTYIKVNVYMPDGNGGKKQFYYTGYYRLISVNNNFSNGMFTQQLTMIMVD